MALTYDKRNLATLNELAPNTKAAALKWYDFCVKNNINILITDALRTLEEQKKHVASGASKTMKSYHLVGQALDFVPIVNGRVDYNKYSNPDIVKAINEAKRLGFTWGGDWKTFIDKPHLQYEYKGYGTDKVLEKKPLSDAVKLEIQRKAAYGIPLSDTSDAEKNELYRKAVATANEVRRKAKLGIPLSDKSNPVYNKLWEETYKGKE